MPVSTSTTTREFKHPSCTLVVSAQPSPLAKWWGRSLVQSVLFRLQIHPPLEPAAADSANPPTPLPLVDLQGNQTQLAELAEAVETYVQTLVGQSYSQFNLGLPWKADPVDTETDPWADPPLPNAPPVVGPAPFPDDTPANGAASNPEVSQGDKPTQPETQSPTGPSLRPNSLLTHVLDLGEAWRTQGVATARRVGVPQDPIALSVSQLFDLANVLDEYRQEMDTLPVQERSTRLLPQAPPVWAKTAAMFILALGITGGVGWWLTSGGLLQVASDAPDTGAAPVSQAPSAPGGNPPASSPTDRLPVEVPPSPGNANGKPAQTLAQNPAAKETSEQSGQQLASSNSGQNSGQNPSSATEIESTAPGKPGAQTGSTQTGSAQTGTSGFNPNARTRTPRPERSLGETAVAATGAATGSTALSSTTLARTPASADSDSGKQPTDASGTIALAPNPSAAPNRDADSLEARTSSLESSQFSTNTKLQGEVVSDASPKAQPAPGYIPSPAAIVPPPASIAPAPPPSPTGQSSDDLSGPVAQVRSYFLRQWNPQDQAQRARSYTVELNPNGTVRSVSPNQVAEANGPQLSLPSPGQPLTTPLSSGQVETVRVDLNPDGSVDAQLQ